MKYYDFFPSVIKIKYDHLQVDNLYVSTLSIVSFENNINLFETINKLLCLDEMEITIHVIRKNNFEILKKLTNIIANSNAEIKSISKNQIDINVIDNTKQNAIELRKKIQVENEQIYIVNIYISLKADSLKELNILQKQIINHLYSNQIIAKPTNFKQKEAYVSSLPLMKNNDLLSSCSNNIFTEKVLSKLFPFYTDSVLHKNGIMVGKVNNNLCILDIFEQKNNNYNMCIFGSSGVGKSYFVKLMIIKNAYKGTRQIIIDLEGEYIELVTKLGGRVFDIDNYNPFEIDESAILNLEFYENKINQIANYINELADVKDINLLKEYIKYTYKYYGISDNKDSLYQKNDNNMIFVKPKYINKFPNIYDLINIIKNENKEMYENVKYLKTNVKGYRNDTEIYCFRIKGLTSKQIEKEMKIFIPKIYEMIKSETLIYFDEVWKSIYNAESNYVIENLYNMFKTLRKRNAGIVIISQDVADLFNMDNGNLGKSILNNSNTKLLFNMEWQDLDVIKKMFISQNIQDNLLKLTRGNAYVILNNTSFELEILATDYEHYLIEGDKSEKGIIGNE